MLGIERFEGALSLEVKGEQDGHDFAISHHFAIPHLSLPLPPLGSTAQQMLLPRLAQTADKSHRRDKTGLLD